MLKCPVCNNALVRNEKQWVCPLNHSYDISKKHTVNLLQSQRSKNRNHGDDQKMVIARTRFLNTGLYNVLSLALVEALGNNPQTMADLGCGEGWYTQNVYDHYKADIVGIDVSKQAVEHAAKRCKDITWVVGSTFEIPLLSESVDACWSIFAPFDAQEVQRILKPSGIFVQIVPQKDHLHELKEAIYDTVIENAEVPFLTNLTLVQEKEIKSMIHLETNEQIRDLFAMTPYVYRTPERLTKRLDEMYALDVRISCSVRIYSK